MEASWTYGVSFLLDLFFIEIVTLNIKQVSEMLEDEEKFSILGEPINSGNCIPVLPNLVVILLNCAGDVEKNPGPPQAGSISIARLKEILSEINSYDKFQVRNYLNKFCVVEPSDEINRMRLVLKKTVLEEILKIENNAIFRGKLKETVNFLQDLNMKYSCCLAGCRYECVMHRYYLQHIKISHPNLTKIMCNFKKSCLRSFSSFEDLIIHVKEDHSKVMSDTQVMSRPPVLDIPSRCNMISCGSKFFQSVTQLMTHFNTHHSGDARECIFKNCSKKFASGSKSRDHFRNVHIKPSLLDLKDVHQVQSHNIPPVCPSSGVLDLQVEELEDVVDENHELYDAFEIDELENITPDEESEDFFLHYYADFLNRLMTHKNIPSSTVQSISEEYFKNAKKSQNVREKKLRETLEALTDVTEVQVNKIVNNVLGEDSFLKAHERLNTQHKRLKFVKDHMKYVAPLEIVLNKSEVERGVKKDCIHYVPLDSALKNLLEDKSTIGMMKKEENLIKEKDKIVDIQDGTLYKSSQFFKDNPTALSLLFYSDGVEIVNPIGSARGTYKIIQVFFTLCDFPKSQRSQIDRLQLAMIFREKLLRKYSFKTIYKRMMEDLTKLEQDGILIRNPEENIVKFGLLLHAADNLEAHSLGGFSSCFSSKYVCRFCLIQYDKLDTNIHDWDGEEAHKRWTCEDYDRIAASLPQPEEEPEIYEIGDDFGTQDSDESDESELSEDDDSEDEISDNRGIKLACPLNVLENFHSVTSFPPDLLHDHFEGVIAEDLLSIIKCLASKGWFTLELYNKALKDLGWVSHEAPDKPQSVPIGRQVKKLKGKAIRQGFKIVYLTISLIRNDFM